jgi:membrane protease YdiL (CAAX protease family)
MHNSVNALCRLVARRPIGSFLLLAYGWSWLFWVPRVLLYRREGVAFPAFALTIGAYGPTVAALLVTALVDGRHGSSALLRKYIAWRVGIWWYGAALFALWVPTIGVMGIHMLRGGSLGAFDVSGLASLPLLIATALPNGPLAEELGWRGFLLSRVAARMSLWRASVLVGVAWTFWHAPLFYAPAGTFISGAAVTPAAVAIYLALVTGLSFLIAWVWRHTNGSVLLAILMHLAINTNALGVVFPAVARVQFELIYLSIFMLWLFILTIVFLERPSWTVTPASSSERVAV